MALGGRQAAEIVKPVQHLNVCIRVGPECTQASAPAWAERSGWPERIRRDARTAVGGILCANGTRLRRRPYSANIELLPRPRVGDSTKSFRDLGMDHTEVRGKAPPGDDFFGHWDNTHQRKYRERDEGGSVKRSNRIQNVAKLSRATVATFSVVGFGLTRSEFAGFPISTSSCATNTIPARYIRTSKLTPSVPHQQTHAFWIQM